jgi:hypothetical protein
MARVILALDGFERTFGHPLVLPSDLAQFHLQRGYQHCLETIDDCCQSQGLGGQIALDSAQTYAAKACPSGGSSLEGHGDCSEITAALFRIHAHCVPTWSGQITVRTVKTYKEKVTDGPVTSDQSSIEDCYVQYSTDANGLVGSSAGTGYYGIKGNLKASGRCGYVYNGTFTDNSPACGPTITTVKDTAAALISATATCGFIWQLTNSPPPPFPILLPSTVIPMQALIEQTHQVPGDSHSETKSFTESTDSGSGESSCLPKTDLDSGTIRHDFSGVIYLNFQPTVQGTADQFKGFWSTNMPHSDGLTTTSIMADWSFSRN